MPTGRKPDPPPLETDDVRIVAAGVVLWAVALAVLAIARVAGAGVRTWWLVMCAYGVALGLVGVSYCRRRRSAVARDRGAPDEVGSRADTT